MTLLTILNALLVSYLGPEGIGTTIYYLLAGQ